MNTVARSALALTAAVIAPVAPILVPIIVSLLNSNAEKAAGWQMLQSISVMMLSTSVLHVVVLGLPTFLLLHRLRAIRWWSSVLIGFVLGCLPITVELWPRVEPDLQTTASHWNGERMVHTMIDGVPTPEAWLQMLPISVMFGAFGAVGGLAFWLVWRGLQPRAMGQPSAGEQ